MVRAPVDIPHHRQSTDYTCGPAALKMVLHGIWGVQMDEGHLADRMQTTPDIGTRQKVMLHYAQELGLRAHVHHTDATLDDIRDHMARGHVVLVCYWLTAEDTDHYAVVDRITKDAIYLQDPWAGPETRLDLAFFDAHWYGDPDLEHRMDRWLLAVEVPEATALDNNRP